MDISLRLKTIAQQVDKCNSLADIGTDHGYIPIYLIKQNICKKIVASDINIGPVEKAKLNASLENLEEVIECRLGGGLSVLKPYEVEVIIIAGMGGNLIRDIIEADIDVFKSLKYAILQPVQNPEILRAYLYKKGFNIIDEELCKDDNKYYEIIKVCFDTKPNIKEDIFYEISEVLLEKKHQLMEEYLDYKLKKYEKIHNGLIQNTQMAINRKIELETKMQHIKELMACL